MGTGGKREFLIFLRLVRQGQQGGNALFQNNAQRAVHLQLLDVFGKIPAGHSFVRMLVTGFVGELFQPGLDVMLGNLLPEPDGL